MPFFVMSEIIPIPHGRGEIRLVQVTPQCAET